MNFFFFFSQRNCKSLKTFSFSFFYRNVKIISIKYVYVIFEEIRIEKTFHMHPYISQKICKVN